MQTVPVLQIDQFLLNEGQGFYVNRLKDHLINHHNKIAEPHRHSFYLTVLFTKGHGVHEIDFVEYAVKPGRAYTLIPGQMHHWQLSEDADGFVFFHSKEFYLLRDNRFEIDSFPFFQTWRNSPEIVLDAQPMLAVVDLFDSLLKEKETSSLLKPMKQHALVSLVYIEFTRIYHARSENHLQARSLQIAQAFERLAEKHFAEVKAPSRYASMANVSLKHLNRVSQEVFGKTATQVVGDRVVLEAKRYLISRQLSISEIANRLGYTDYSYFSRFFKKQTGLSPVDFRKKVLSQLA